MSILSNSVKKYGYLYLLLIILATIHIFWLKDGLKEQLKLDLEKDLEQFYSVYKKVYLISSSVKSIFVENDNFIDNSDMINQLTKSTPFYVNKKDKMIHKYEIIFNFMSNDDIKNNEYMSKKVIELGNKKYIFEVLDNNLATFFAKVYDDGYLLISKQIEEENGLRSKIDLMFYEIFIFGLINFVVFWYLLNLVKKNKSTVYEIAKEYQKMELDTKKKAYEDPLTKASSRLKLNETLQDMIQIASRFRQNGFGLVLFDIDKFKNINDTYGHDYGDIVLQEVAKTVKENIRSSDLFARWGGEEFVVVFPMNSIEQTIKMAEKLRVEIENTKFDKIEKVTCSFGVIVYDGETDINTLIKKADLLLYKAKQNGRNRVEF